MTRFKVVSVHFTKACNLKCGFCYRGEQDLTGERPREFFLDLIPYIKQLAPQVACLHPNETIFQYNPDNGSVEAKPLYTLREGSLVIGDGEPCMVKKIIEKETNEQMFEIIATGNRKIRLTENHQVPTGRGLLFVKDLVVGDELRINKKVDVTTIKEINIRKILEEKKIPFRVDENGKMVIERHDYRYPQTIKITPEFARLCGYYVSEGHMRGFSFCEDEKGMHREVINDFKEVFGLDLIKIHQTTGKGIQLETRYSFVMNLVFNLACGFGRGSKNLGIGCAWRFEEKMLKEFLRGLIGGDGCLRARSQERDGRVDKTVLITYKTASKRLAEELRFLLESRLGVMCSFVDGVSPERYIGDRKIKATRYYGIEIYGKENMATLVERAELMHRYHEFKKIFDSIGHKKYSNHRVCNSIIKIKSIKKVKCSKTVIDIQVDKNRLFTSTGNIVVHNCGGGEPLVDIPFIKQFALECKAHNLICNITTNGRKFLEMSDEDIKDTLKDITMISVSFDSYKWPEPRAYMELIHRLKKLTRIQIGANMLLELPMFINGSGLGMARTVQWLFEKAKVDRVFALYPKNVDFDVDITKEGIKSFYQALTMKYKRFYVDDVSKEILAQGYDNWKIPCHRGKDIISIDEKGGVSMCSFDKPIIILDKPKYLIDVVDAIKVCGFDSCPFVHKPSGIIQLRSEE